MNLITIGVIRSPYPTREEAPKSGYESVDECVIEVCEEFLPALEGVEEFDRLVVLYWLHQARRETLRVYPRGQSELKGVFASRSPDRPNPIGLSVVRLIEKERNKLRVVGLDALDGTPLLDIKPALPEETGLDR
ncbi:MAG: tRNA (N6-threonylcarbamoyladenosine(37)-N6)-methyltransferase TrmO [Syntrophothermus sp.]|uniref:tRNA (N6-threonylcarbamoyladenosine(37)-N6)-methyltransferase TrmO n=1 Tax=Syntrophothermus sp. TaxID=2736299 RepID=UPI00257946BA|nr:tRNA (N6-threonylcarbamoyladenosine(37)-N6)-methyltransferase TrmO [Syntrophothermus sp.]NSW82208.1 tRNA (N6-threonylcarbamoyladenosine(37)-N6)-methyltransferase TrmO [Syntrophothermus sp.]